MSQVAGLLLFGSGGVIWMSGPYAGTAVPCSDTPARTRTRMYLLAAPMRDMQAPAALRLCLLLIHPIASISRPIQMH
jgi:hypothetical protein